MTTDQLKVPLNSMLILRSDGREETEYGKPSFLAIQYKTGYNLLDSVNLRNGLVMLVSDTGMIDGLPVNAAATAIYHAMCRPGTVHSIHGDAVIVNDEDFA